MTDGDSATRTLSEFVSGVRFADLPAEVVHQAKRSILDTVGCGLFGSTLPWSATVLSVLAHGTGPAVAWGTGQRLSPAEAALANGTFVHGFELDDLHKEGCLHMGAVTLPATLAVAPLAPRPPTGEELICAQVAGYEIGARIGLAVAPGMLERGFHITGVVGALTGAAAAARLLRLDPDATQDAIGMAGSFAGGLGAAQYGSSVKRMHAGRAAQAGVYSGLLGAGGFRGIRDLFEVPHGGFLGTFTATGERAELTRELGTRWQTAILSYKPYAACAASHTSIDAALALREQGLRADQIQRVVVSGSTSMRDHVGWRYEPDTMLTAQMNLAYAVACAFVDGKVGVDQFAEERLADPRLLALTDRIEVRPDPATDARGRRYRHATTMTVHTRDGRTLTAGFEHGRGSEHRPLSDEELMEKYRDQAGRVLPADRVDKLARTVWSLERAGDLTELLDLLAG